MKHLLSYLLLLGFSALALAAGLDLNSATEAQLAALPPLGPAKAKAIVDFRGNGGCFSSVNDLAKVRGLTRADADAVSSLVTVGACPQSGPGKSKAQT